jgi:hypothetical protein
MSFIAPLFFVALAGLAIPVLIHLIQREKKQIIRFPSLMFVQRVPYKSVQRRRIHNWLLLLVRLSALAMIVFAFARPFVERQQAIVPGVGAREVVVLLDQSYSIGYADRWERARAAAYDAIGKLAPGDRASVVLFGSGVDIALKSTGAADRASLNAAVAAAKPTPAATRYAPALKVAGSILTESPLPRREVILVSDFQRGGWRGEEGARLPARTTLTPVVIGGPLNSPNVSVTSVSLARTTFTGTERVAVTASVVNRANAPVAGNSLVLELAGRPIQTETLNLQPNGSTSVTFAPFTLAANNVRATVRVASDALPADNAFNFVVSPIQPVRVVIVDRVSNGPGPLYLMRALSIGDAPRFETIVRQPDGVTEEDLRRASAVILNDVVVPAGLGRRLARFVENGGGLLVASGPRGAWPADADILPGIVQAPVDRTRGDAARVGALEFGHPIFEPFRAPRSGDFSAARIYGYRTVMPAMGVQVLARFDGGSPALLERKVGTGRVLLWASTLDLAWSDFPLKPVFLPFIHRTVRHLAAYAEPAPWVTVGQVLDASFGSGAGARPRGQVVLTPSGRRVAVDDEGSEVLELSEQGFYEVRGGQPGDTDVTVVASNVDPGESDLSSMDPKEIVAAAVGGADADAAATAGVAQTPETQERSQRLWWYLLVAGIVLLGADTIISNRLSKT